MGFLLKKFLGLLVQPLTIVLVLLIVGTVLLFREKRIRVGKVLVATGSTLLLLLSLQYVPFALGRFLETQYSPYDPASAAVQPAYVVVLGGGVKDDPSLPPTARLSPTALARVVEGVRIARAHAAARLVLTGGAVFADVTEAEVAAELAQTLGIEPSRIVREDRSMDTADQARTMQAFAGDDPLILVTSAVHMPRSMALFRAQGLSPIAAPTAHLFDDRLERGPRLVLPSAENLRALELVMHEMVGYAWAWLRGLV